MSNDGRAAVRPDASAAECVMKQLLGDGSIGVNANPRSNPLIRDQQCAVGAEPEIGRSRWRR